MDQSKKQISEMEKQLGRMMRTMSLARMAPFRPGSDWTPAADVYETASDVVICMEIPGINPEEISVIAEQQSVVIGGDRRFPPVENASCIHQLEIENGRFERTISLPVPVEVAGATSTYKNGFLLIRLPKLGARGKIAIQVG